MNEQDKCKLFPFIYNLIFLFCLLFTGCNDLFIVQKHQENDLKVLEKLVDEEHERLQDQSDDEIEQEEPEGTFAFLNN